MDITDRLQRAVNTLESDGLTAEDWAEIEFLCTRAKANIEQLRDALKVERERGAKLAQEKASLIGELDRSEAERDRAVEECDKAIVERDTARGERDRALKDLDIAFYERDNAIRAIMAGEPRQQVEFLNSAPVVSPITAIDPIVERLLDIIERLVNR